MIRVPGSLPLCEAIRPSIVDGRRAESERKCREMKTVIERELELKLVLSSTCSVAVPAQLRYSDDDPYAVHISFHTDTPHPVYWTFARDLLVEGVFRPCGHGDVRVWPTKVDGRNVVCMALTSPDGDALLEIPSAPIAAWLERTLRIVPPGTEAARLGVDDGLRLLLTPTPVDDPCAGELRPSDDPGETGA